MNLETTLWSVTKPNLIYFSGLDQQEIHVTKLTNSPIFGFYKHIMPIKSMKQV